MKPDLPRRLHGWFASIGSAPDRTGVSNVDLNLVECLDFRDGTLGLK